MIHQTTLLAVLVFSAFVGATLFLSFALAAKTKSAKAYFAAHGEVHWIVNGIAFAGDYLSAASFLGICGMIAFFGFDGFLYAIGYLAGWVVALLVVAEPMKRLGKYTFADAIDAPFQSSGIRLAAAVSTLVVSLFYLIPQMVGAGVLIQPLLGFSHQMGVLLVGAVVILIVTTAGMVSTTYVQFLKGSLLVLFSLILVGLILGRGLQQKPLQTEGVFAADRFQEWRYPKEIEVNKALLERLGPTYEPLETAESWKSRPYLRFRNKETGGVLVFRLETGSDSVVARRCQWTSSSPDPTQPLKVGGLPLSRDNQLLPVGSVTALPGESNATGPIGPLGFLETIQGSTILLWANEKFKDADGINQTVYYPVPTQGSEVLRPGNLPAFRGIRTGGLSDKLNFLSLMLALFCGTASLPHILIRYYTVKDGAAARNSTVVGILTIGSFYLLTLFIGLGAMTSGALDVGDSNMAAPLLARTFGEWMFAAISAIAFTTVLGTVSGLIVAASGAVAHDLIEGCFRTQLTDEGKVRAGKISALVVGLLAIVLGIVFQKMNVNFLVGWAFSVAASANLPALVMLLFWKGTTRLGVIAAIWIGLFTSLTWILLSSDTYRDVYGWDPTRAVIPFSQPGIVTIPLGFVVLIVVSLLERKTLSPGRPALSPSSHS